MEWKPTSILTDSQEPEPTEPTKPGFEGFEGADRAPYSKMEATGGRPVPRAFLTLTGGLTLPVEVIELVLNLERRGIPLVTDADHQFIIPNDPTLTVTDRASIARWRHHLGAAVEYRAPEIA
jgi:hypothetical protein